MKVGFLTVDELMLAGRSWNEEMQDYFYNNYYYWLGSPSQFIGNAYVFYSIRSIQSGTERILTNSFAYRPVVTLSANTPYTGSGTTTNPFVVN